MPTIDSNFHDIFIGYDYDDDDDDTCVISVHFINIITKSLLFVLLVINRVFYQI